MAHSITVGIRMRPMVEHEAGQNPCFALTEPSDVDILPGAAHHVSQPKGFEGPWRFDHAMDSSSNEASPALFTDNGTCYEKMGKPMLAQAMEGFNVCLFCYGQTGSGKTTTIMGDAANGEGVLVRLLRDLFAEMDLLRAEGATCDVSVQMLEVYNETVHDLLQPNREEMLKTKVNVHLLPRGVTVQGSTSKAVETVDECMKYVEHANRLKTMHATAMNPQSSRGHVIFKLYFHKSGGPDGMLLDSEIYFADLAGHENEKTTHVVGERFKELTFINKSLMWLQQAIHGLATESGQKDHADMHMFRNSKLTMILSPALTGNSRTAIIVTLSPAAAHFDTSIASLKFAVEAKSIKVEAKRNKSADPYVRIKELEAEILELKAEAKEMKERLAHYEAGGEILPPLDFAERPPASPKTLGGPPSSPRSVRSPPASPKLAPAVPQPEIGGGPPLSPREKIGAAVPQPEIGGGPPLSPRERRGSSGGGGTAGEAEAPADKQPGSASTPARNTGQRRGSAQAQAQGKAAPKKAASGTVPPGGARRGSAAQAQGKAASRRPNASGTSGGSASASRPGGAERAAPADQSSNPADSGSAVVAVAPEVGAAVAASPEDSLIEGLPQNGAGTGVPTVAGAVVPAESQKRITGLLEALQKEVQEAFAQLAAAKGGQSQEKISGDVLLYPPGERKGVTAQAEGGGELDGRMQSLQTSMLGLEEHLGSLSQKMTMLQDTFSAKAGEQGGSAGTNSLPWLQQDNSSVQLAAHSPGAARQHHPADQKVEGVHLGSPDHCEAAAHPHYVRAGAAPMYQQAMMPQAAGMQQPLPNWAAAGQRGRFQVAAMPQSIARAGCSREWTPRGDRAACVSTAQYPCRAPDLHHGGSHRAGSRFGVDPAHSHVVVRRLSPVTRGMDAAHQRSQQFYPHVSPPHFPQRQESFQAGLVAATVPPVSPVRHHSVIRASTGSAAERTSADNSPAVSRRYLRIAVAGETSQSEIDVETQ